MMMHRRFAIIALGPAALVMAACQSAGDPASTAQAVARPADTPPRSPDDTLAKGQSVPNLVQGVCGDCHGVEPPFLSPNRDAPAFDAIANSAGLTDETLSSWLIDAHNYPEMMEFELTEAEARKVADYMLTLRSEDYRPAP